MGTGRMKGIREVKKVSRKEEEVRHTSWLLIKEFG